MNFIRYDEKDEYMLHVFREVVCENSSLGVPHGISHYGISHMGFEILKIPIPYGIFLKIPMGFWDFLTTILRK